MSAAKKIPTPVRLATTADGRVVRYEDLDAAFLYAAPGELVPGDVLEEILKEPEPAPDNAEEGPVAPEELDITEHTDEVAGGAQAAPDEAGEGDEAEAKMTEAPANKMQRRPPAKAGR